MAETGTPAPAAPVAPPALRVLGLSKAFGGTQALDGVSFDVHAGTIHALLGGNGSGKSTTIKILAGVYTADAGEIGVGDEIREATWLTPARARELGLRFVHQQQSTFDDLTVAENLAAGRGFETTRLGRIRWGAVRRRTREVLERFEINADPDAVLTDLGPATRTMVAIARALQDEEGESRSILVLDEPTAALPATEAQLLLDALTRYARAGQTIMYVTHRLDEVTQVADRATVLRDGKLVDTVDRGAFTHETLVQLIMGKTVDALPSRSAARRPGSPLVEARGLTGGPVQEVDFSLYPGEIVGVAGLLGSGRSSLLRMLFGCMPSESGEILVDGETVTLTRPRAAMAQGIAYVPEDRPREAAFADLDLTENMGMASTARYFRAGRLRHRREQRDAADLMRSYLIRAESPTARFASLSGGNQQKGVLVRWLRRSPRVLLLDEPTQGVDVGARLEIWQLVRAAVDDGATALVVSSDFEELPAVCDRVLVLRGGRIAAEVSGEEMTTSRLEHLTMAAEVVR